MIKYINILTLLNVHPNINTYQNFSHFVSTDDLMTRKVSSTQSGPPHIVGLPVSHLINHYYYLSPTVQMDNGSFYIILKH